MAVHAAGNLGRQTAKRHKRVAAFSSEIRIGYTSRLRTSNCHTLTEPEAEKLGGFLHELHIRSDFKQHLD